MHDAPRPPLTETLAARADHRRWLLAGLVLVIYLAGYNAQWRPGPDSAAHLTIAQGLLDGRGFTHPAGWHEQLNGGLAHLVAGVSRPFGRVHMPASTAAVLVITLAALAVTFELLRVTLGRPQAVLLTGLLALTETYYRLGFELLTDMPFCFGLALMLLGWAYLDRQTAPLRRGGGWVLLILGVAIMTLFRSVAITVLVGVALTVAWRLIRGPGRGRAAAMGAACLATWLVVRPISIVSVFDEARIGQRLLDELPLTLRRLATENAPSLAMENAAEALLGVDFGPILSILLFAVVAVAWWRLLRTSALWGLITAAFFLQWLLFMPGDRYFLPVLMPLLVGWWQTARWLEQKLSGGAARVAVAFMVLLWLTPNAVRVGRFIVEQRSTPFLEHYDRGRYAHLKRLAERLSEQVEPEALVIGADGPVLTWYSGRRIMDPKQVRIQAGMDKWRMSELIQPFEPVYVLKPDDPTHARLMLRLPLELGESVLTVPRDGEEPPWTLHPARLEKKFRPGTSLYERMQQRRRGASAVEPGQLDDEDKEDADGEGQ